MSPVRARQNGLDQHGDLPAGETSRPRGRSSRAPRSTRRSSIPTASIASSARHASSPASATPSPPSRDRATHPLKAGDVLVLIGRGPLGAGMEEIYQITSALKHLSFGKQIAVVTDARFSGVSTGACIGHVGPEALAGGPIGQVRDGDMIRIVVDRNRLEGTIDLVGGRGAAVDAAEGTRILAGRSPHPDLSPDPELPDDTRLWAALQAVERRHLGRLRLRPRRDHRAACAGQGSGRKKSEVVSPSVG